MYKEGSFFHANIKCHFYNCSPFQQYVSELRQRYRFDGFSLYVSNNGYIKDSSLCYKDGPQLPTLNFTTTCITAGRYVIFYNERYDNAKYPEEYKESYTELCEVYVNGK